MSQNIFDTYMPIESLFKNKDVLRVGHTPSVLLHRDKEIQHLASKLSDAFKDQTPSNIFICGKPGTGKTATAKYVGDQLLRKAKQLNSEYVKNAYSLILERSGGIFDNISPNEGRNEQDGPGGEDGETGSGNEAPGPNERTSLYDTEDRFLRPEDLLGEKLTEGLSMNIEYVYINCKHVDTKYRVLTNIVNELTKDDKEKLPSTGLTTDMVIEKLISRAEKKAGVVIIVLDEIDNLLHRSGDDTLHILSRLNEELGRSKTSLICISHDANVLQMVDASVNSSLPLDINVFKPYNAEELRDILDFRANKAFNKNVCPYSVISLCAAYAARDNGDARRALSLLTVSGEVAENEGEKSISERHVKRAVEKIETDSVKEVVQSLPLHCKLTLGAILLQQHHGTNRITTGSVYESYVQLCRKKGVSNLTKRRISDFISELSTVGMIDTALISSGAYGRTRVIHLAACPDTLEHSFYKDRETKRLMMRTVNQTNYRHRQATLL